MIAPQGKESIEYWILRKRHGSFIGVVSPYSLPLSPYLKQKSVALADNA
jgi:hypothetical protein